MCGICGHWGRCNPSVINRMVAAMRHRGPDDAGTFYEEKISLGMTRLAIIDTSMAGHQPMSNSEKTIWIVYNGETYNFQSERQILENRGVKFNSESDTEVILKLYECYGDSFLNRLRGIFALAIYDKRRGPGSERFLLARDHFGIKPLLYTCTDQGLLFASEMKAMIASQLITPEVDFESLRLLLTFGSVYQPRTILSGVKMLQPAHKLVIENGRYTIERYWSLGLDRVQGIHNRSYTELVENVASALEESTRLQMVSDVPLGAFLSGGVDSSLLVGIMARHAGHRIKTFSVGFEAEGNGMDESFEAHQTAEYLGTDHTQLIVTGEDVRKNLADIVLSLDQPSVDGVNSYFISRAACQSVTVAISGTGGDEIFSGYPSFLHTALYEEELKDDPSSAIRNRFIAGIFSSKLFDPLMAGKWGPKVDFYRNSFGFTTRWSQFRQMLGVVDTARLLSSAIYQKAKAGRAISNDLKSIDELSYGDSVERTSALCLRGYMNNQLLRDIDSVSMAHSLEVRVPFLDVPLVDLALSLPLSSKLGKIEKGTNLWTASYRDSGRKKVLIDAGHFLGLLRPDIDLQTKRGFEMPFNFWLKGPLKQILLEVLSPDTIIRRGWFNPPVVKEILNQFLEGKRNWVQPWLLMVIELWARQTLPN
jgi:asparagine synthase (glutamine-hydrolysing)